MAAAKSIYAALAFYPDPGNPGGLLLRPDVFNINVNGSDLITLYTADTSRGDNVNGFFYLPPLPPSSPCWPLLSLKPNASESDSMWPENYNSIGLAPWTGDNCTQAFLDAASSDEQAVQAFVFYPQHNDILPTMDDPFWNGINYKDLDFPVYAVSRKAGGPLMEQIMHYSENETQYIDHWGYSRVYAQVNTGSRPSLPGLWIFLLIVIVVILVLLGLTSVVMHVVQYRNRVNLRRRVASGEVDLEALGIQRLTVPPNILEKLPLHAYIPDPSSLSEESKFPLPPPPVLDRTLAAPSPPLPPSPSLSPVRPSTTAGPRPTEKVYSQDSCAICIDNFEQNSSVIRELPCGHIYHPPCIDPFLENQSSLCPLCKQTVLPKGYVPPFLGTAHVRRERVVRRARERSSQSTRSTPRWRWNRPRWLERIDESTSGVPMAETGPRQMRRLGRRGTGISGPPMVADLNAEERRRGKWRRAFGIIFPGF